MFKHLSRNELFIFSLIYENCFLPIVGVGVSMMHFFQEHL